MTRSTFPSEEARIVAWLDTLHVLAQVHRARRAQVVASRRKPPVLEGYQGPVGASTPMR